MGDGPSPSPEPVSGTPGLADFLWSRIQVFRDTVAVRVGIEKVRDLVAVRIAGAFLRVGEGVAIGIALLSPAATRARRYRAPPAHPADSTGSGSMVSS